ncbi:MAG: hypothetical protein WA709_10315 [Stellaceae bacterium]
MRYRLSLMLKRFSFPTGKLKLKAQLPNPMSYLNQLMKIKVLLKVMWGLRA